jgi:hypothetical protein
MTLPICPSAPEILSYIQNHPLIAHEDPTNPALSVDIAIIRSVADYFAGQDFASAHKPKINSLSEFIRDKIITVLSPLFPPSCFLHCVGPNHYSEHNRRRFIATVSRVHTAFMDCLIVPKTTVLCNKTKTQSLFKKAIETWAESQDPKQEAEPICNSLLPALTELFGGKTITFQQYETPFTRMNPMLIEHMALLNKELKLSEELLENLTKALREMFFSVRPPETKE